MKLTSGLYKLFYMPLCRFYARYKLGGRPADWLMRYLCILPFWRVYHFIPNFVSPRRFSEKLWNRMLFDRDPRWTTVSDKLRVRDYVSKKVGKDCLIPLLWSGDGPEDIPFDDLPSKFVVKANHGCGYNIIVKDKVTLDKIKTKQKLKKWLAENFCQDKYLGTEWGYKNIRPTILIESFIEDAGKAPVDYKFYCFSGRAEIFTLHFDRFEDHKTNAFDRNFEPLESRSNLKKYKGEYYLPSNIEAMIQLAESLAEGFDFIRVDLYNLKNKIYFGELTPYPGGVSLIQGFDILSHDIALGEKWENI